MRTRRELKAQSSQSHWPDPTGGEVLIRKPQESPEAHVEPNTTNKAQSIYDSFGGQSTDGFVHAALPYVAT